MYVSVCSSNVRFDFSFSRLLLGTMHLSGWTFWESKGFLTVRFDVLICLLFLVFQQQRFFWDWRSSASISLWCSFTSFVNVVLLLGLFPVHNALLVCEQAVKPQRPEAHRSKTAPRFERDGKHKSLKKKGFFLKRQRNRTHAPTRHVSQPVLLKPPFWKRPRINSHLSMRARTGNEKRWLQELAAAAPVLTFLRFILNCISSEVKMLWRGAEFPQPSSRSQEMHLEAVVVERPWARETRGISADLNFPLGSGSASGSELTLVFV